MDQDQLNPYVANEGYVVRVPHNPLLGLKAFELNQLINLSLGDNQSVTFCTPWGDLF